MLIGVVHRSVLEMALVNSPLGMFLTVYYMLPRDNIFGVLEASSTMYEASFKVEHG